jgi:hypothetical protein
MKTSLSQMRIIEWGRRTGLNPVEFFKWTVCGRHGGTHLREQVYQRQNPSTLAACIRKGNVDPLRRIKHNIADRIINAEESLKLDGEGIVLLHAAKAFIEIVRIVEKLPDITIDDISSLAGKEVNMDAIDLINGPLVGTMKTLMDGNRSKEEIKEALIRALGLYMIIVIFCTGKYSFAHNLPEDIGGYTTRDED